MCLMQPIQMKLSRNQKVFSEFFSAFAKYTENLQYFVKQDESQRLFLSEIIDCKNRGYLNA